MVDAGQCARIWKQLGCYPVDIIGNYGLQYCKYENGELTVTRDEVVFVGHDYGIGGNDESVYRSDIRFICVDDYRKPEDYLLKL